MLLSTLCQTSFHNVTTCQHQLHHTNSSQSHSNLSHTVFQGTKGYVGPKGDEGEAGDPGNDVSNLCNADSSFPVSTVQEPWAMMGHSPSDFVKL